MGVHALPSNLSLCKYSSLVSLGGVLTLLVCILYSIVAISDGVVGATLTTLIHFAHCLCVFVKSRLEGSLQCKCAERQDNKDEQELNPLQAMRDRLLNSGQ